MDWRGRQSTNIRDLRGAAPEEVARDNLRRGYGQTEVDSDLDYTQDLRSGVPIYTENMRSAGYNLVDSNSSAGQTKKQILLLAQARRRRAEAEGASDTSGRISGAFEAAADQPARGPVTSGTEAFGRGALQGATANFSDEVGALGSSLFGGKTYGQNLAESRRKNTIAGAEHPAAYIGGEVAGGAATALVPGGSAVRGASILGTIGRGALEGAAYGAASGAGAGETPEQRIAGAGSGAVAGGLTGGVLPAAGGVVSRLTRNRNAGPTVDELRTAATALYDQADNAGVVLSGPAFQRIAQNVAVRARNAGIDSSVHPRATGALRRLLTDASGANGSAAPTLRHMDTLRQIIRDAASSPEAGERRIASIMSEGLDENLNRLGARDIQSGDVRTGLLSLREARRLWSRMRKGEQIEQIFENARNAAGANYTQAGIETSLKQQFRAILKNPKQSRTFTQEERDAMRDVVRGSNTERVLRLFGKFSPRGAVSAIPAIAAGATIDLGTGAALAGGAELSRRAASAMAVRNAERVGEIVRNGGAVAARGRSRTTPAVEQAATRGTIAPSSGYFDQLMGPAPLRIYLNAGERQRYLDKGK